MTKETALNRFFNEIMTAYPATAVPDNARLPYMTYTSEDGDFDTNTSITVQMWFKTDSEAVPNAKARELKEKISRGGKLLSFDGGGCWLTCGTPWCISSTAEDDKTIKLRQINIDVNHLG
jgi:hypothetical protein